MILNLFYQIFLSFFAKKITFAPDMNVYPALFEVKTEFDKVKQLIVSKCISSLGAERVEAIACSDNFDVINERLDLTVEFVNIITNETSFPTDYYFDLRAAIQRTRPDGSYFDTNELFNLKRSLQTVYDIVRFFRRDSAMLNYPNIAAIAEQTPIFPQLIIQIDNILDKHGRVKDNASNALLNIRREIEETLKNVNHTLQAILRNAKNEGLVDKDVAPSLRDGRLVIPVAAPFKRRIKGIIHDESASGKTVFIEPQNIVADNNRIRELRAMEKREIIRILTIITDEVRPCADDILASFAFLADIDFIRAKAIFACEFKCVKPRIDNYPTLKWYNAVHPLLKASLEAQNKTIVPLDIELNSQYRLLIISGPNAGGKSICLKTVALLQYMLQCGLLIPIHKDSNAGIFSQLFIDIGDEQSIENDLSTYSSHLRNMNFSVRHSNNKTLLLIDEFGRGTEPNIGGAIAQALLERFNSKGCFGVITTHYGNLKQYAETHSGVINAAMLYDRELMKPLFRLAIGKPGSSFAFDVARKMGLPEDVINEARNIAGNGNADADAFMLALASDKHYWELKRKEIERREQLLNDELDARAEKLKATEQHCNEILKTAKEEAKQLLEESNARIENTIRIIRETQAEKERTRNARAELKEWAATNVGLHYAAPSYDASVPKNVRNSSSDSSSEARKRKPKQLTNADNHGTTALFARGDTVRIKGQASIGELLDVNNNKATVAFNAGKAVIDIAKLEKVMHANSRKNTSAANTVATANSTLDTIHNKLLNFKHEIDVRRMRGLDAVQATMYFLDDALLAGVSPVRIIHGAGNGILKTVIREYLRTAPEVKNFHDEDVRLGGAGVTVIEL
jgi:DNA mismatch repair protein MutS2